jgi:hypothetical protein
MSGVCVNADGGVGVALGWVHQNGTGWSWDCRFRHDWDVPVGVALALIGGRCTDPCELYREQLNELIHLFDVPVTPAPPDDPDDGPVQICYQRVGNRIVNICERVADAPETLDMNRHREIYREKVPFPPRKPEEVAQLIYELPATDWAEAGTISLKGTIGKKTTNVVDELTKVLVDKGNTAPIKVISQNEVNKTAGYQAGITVSAADTLVLVEDGLKKVVGVGSIPANTTMRGAVAEVPRVAGLAEGADQAAKAALDTTTTFTGRLDTLDGKIGGFETFEANFLGWQTTINNRMFGLTNEIEVKALAAVGTYQLAVQNEIDEKIGAAVNAAKGGLVDQFHAELDAFGAGVKADIAKDVQVTTNTLRKEVDANQAELSNKVEGFGQQVALFSGQVEAATQQAHQSNTRVDDLYKTRFDAGVSGVGGIRYALTPESIGVLGNMRNAIVAAATPAQRPKVNAALAESEDAFKALTEATATGPVEFELQREAIGTVLTSMTSAVEAAGAPAADVDRLRVDIGRLSNR